MSRQMMWQTDNRKSSICWEFDSSAYVPELRKSQSYLQQFFVLLWNWRGFSFLNQKARRIEYATRSFGELTDTVQCSQFLFFLVLLSCSHVDDWSIRLTNLSKSMIILQWAWYLWEILRSYFYFILPGCLFIIVYKKSWETSVLMLWNCWKKNVHATVKRTDDEEII